MTNTDLTTSATGLTYDVNMAHDAATGTTAIVLDATAADLLYRYLDGMGSFHDLIDGDDSPAVLAGADILVAIRSLLAKKG